MGEGQKLGHPTITGGGKARISGELRPQLDGSCVMNNASGRYSSYPGRGPTQLNNAAARVRAAGVNVTNVDFVNMPPRAEP